MAWNPLEHLQPVPQKPVQKLPRALKKINFPFAYIGGYGVQKFISERDCYRLDFFIQTTHRSEAHAFFKKRASHTDSYADTHDFFILKRGKLYIGLINSPENWVADAIAEATDHFLPLPWLILTKMWTGSRQDFLDSARLIARAQENDFALVKTLFEQHLPEALPELRRLYQIGKAELDSNPTYQNQANIYSAWHKINAEVKTD